MVKPAVLLLDEPLSNLDANLREEMRFEIRRLHDEFRITTVYVTHDQGEAMVTSDRVAVMNEGRIDQLDAPYVIYNRPTTRFVAGFIGRTNFVEAQSDGTQVGFANLTLPATAFDAEMKDVRGGVTFSVRPQSLKLSSVETGDFALQAQVVQRAYLGDVWDYVVQAAGSDLQLRVSAAPSQTFDVGESVWLELDPAQMALIR